MEQKMVLQLGLEPRTLGLENRCSIQLSYWSLGEVSLFLAASQGNLILLVQTLKCHIANGKAKK